LIQDLPWRNVVDAKLRVLLLRIGRAELTADISREETLDQWLWSQKLEGASGGRVITCTAHRNSQ
jgi:hypothetical protein